MTDILPGFLIAVIIKPGNGSADPIKK